ncbi:MAG: KH domain-containing protein [Candidatus Pacebacteria bacterium]|nr:KH domain-containing protein [Candidatus Paceibacterota bacterium]
MKRSISPAKTISVEINQEEKSANIKVSPDQQSLAIGKRGQNVRLAARLTGYKLNIIAGENIINEDNADEYSDAYDNNY